MCGSRRPATETTGGPRSSPTASGLQVKAVLDVAVPLLVAGSMVVVGLGLTAEDFRRVARRPLLVLAATLGQVLITPLIGQLLVRSLSLALHLADGLLLVVACPAGSMANLYAHLARANVALSVTLTAVSCLAGVLTLPAIMAVNRLSLGGATTYA